MLIAILERLTCILLLAVVIFQMIIPAIRGTKMFPMFRRERKLKEKVIDLNQKVAEKELESEIETIKKEKGVE
jgi:hypothetical protein